MSTIYYRFQIAGHPAADWTTGDPVLLDREFAVETDTGKFKVGDGVTAWTALPYAIVPLSDGDKGDITVSSGGTLFTIDPNVVSNTKFRQSIALSVVGRSANSTGDVADIAAANDGEVLRRSGTTLGFGTVATAGLADDAVTFAKMQNITTARVLGRTTASTGNVEELPITGTGNVVLSASPTLIGIVNLAALIASSYISVAGGIQATGARAYAGAGLGLQYAGGICYMQAYDHVGAAYLPLTIGASSIVLGPSGTAVCTITTASIIATVATVFGGVTYYAQGAPSAVNATATLTIAQLLTAIITTTSASAVSLTLPTGTLTDAGVLSGLANNRAFEWALINLGSASGAVTILAGTDHTFVGNAVIAIGASAQFWTRKTAANTYVTYRVA